VDAFKDKAKWPKGIILMANADKSAFYFTDNRGKEKKDDDDDVVWAKLWLDGDMVRIHDINHAVYSLSLIKELAQIEAEYQLANNPEGAKQELVKNTRDRVAKIRWPLRILFGRSEQEGLSA
jgi:hypothetical protein